LFTLLVLVIAAAKSPLLAKSARNGAPVAKGESALLTGGINLANLMSNSSTFDGHGVVFGLFVMDEVHWMLVNLVQPQPGVETPGYLRRRLRRRKSRDFPMAQLDQQGFGLE
jgi:hypothetical protein